MQVQTISREDLFEEFKKYMTISNPDDVVPAPVVHNDADFFHDYQAAYNKAKEQHAAEELAKEKKASKQIASPPKTASTDSSFKISAPNSNTIKQTKTYQSESKPRNLFLAKS